MPIEFNKYEIECSHCNKLVVFKTTEVEELAEDIEDAIDDADTSARSEMEAQFDYYVKPEEAVDGRALQELSAAIRAGDRAEAEILLDRIASELGDKATEQVQLGRYSVKAMV